MLHLASGHCSWLHSEISELDDLGTFESQVIISLYNDERDRVARVAKVCLDAGIAERQVALSERYGSALAHVFRCVFDDPELGLTSAQRERLPEILRRYLGQLEGNPAIPVTARIIEAA